MALPFLRSRNYAAKKLRYLLLAATSCLQMLAMAGLAGIVDRVGRRPLLLRGLVAMAACMAAIP